MLDVVPEELQSLGHLIVRSNVMSPVYYECVEFTSILISSGALNVKPVWSIRASIVFLCGTGYQVGSYSAAFYTL